MPGSYRDKQKGSARVMPSEIAAERNMTMEIPHPPCPAGFDKDKWN